IVQRLKRTSDDPAAKREALRALMRETAVKNAIIFCNRKKDVGTLYRSLQRHGFNVGALHGDLDQHQRTATLDAFRNGSMAFLAASDVAARGLDIPAVSHIFNYDVPIHPEDYVHRIGRTGRAGREGFAAMLVTPKDFKALKAIEKMLRQEIPWIDGAPTPDEIAEARDRPEYANGRHKRGGRSRRPNRAGPNGHSPRVHAAPPKRSEPPQSQETAVAGNGHQHPKRDDRRHGQHHDPHKHYGERKQPPAPHSKVKGMGDHVPAFMTRPVRVP
ncbi:MAG: helicase-related protein, partial [Methyloceanibacter sp.]